MFTKLFLVLWFVLFPVPSRAEENILQKIWSNLRTSMSDDTCENRVEVTAGRYVNAVGTRNFTLARSACEFGSVKEERVRIDFADTRGHKYLRIVRVENVVHDIQLIRHANDPHRIRLFSGPRYEPLEGTRIPPFFLTMSIQMLAVYEASANVRLDGSVRLRAEVLKRGKGILPDSLELEVEQRNGHYAPTLLICRMYDVELYRFEIENDFVATKLRPRRISISVPGTSNKDTVIFDEWRIAEVPQFLNEGEFLKEIYLPTSD